MKQLLTALLLFISVSSQGQTEQTCCINEDALTKFQLKAFILRPHWDSVTNTNTWEVLNDIHHASIGIDTVIAYNDRLRVFWNDTAYKINTVLCGIDEGMGRSAFLPFDSDLPTYSNTFYNAGGSCYLNYVDIRITQACDNAFFIRYNGTQWVHQTGTGLIGIAPYSAPANSYDMTYVDGGLTVSHTGLLEMQHFPVFTQFAGNQDTSLMKYIPSIEPYNGSFKISWYDVVAKDRIRGNTPPTNLGVFVLGGVTGCLVNPRTRAFPISSNFWGIAVMQRY